jgi:hypothetical protein
MFRSRLSSKRTRVAVAAIFCATLLLRAVRPALAICNSDNPCGEPMSTYLASQGVSLDEVVVVLVGTPNAPPEPIKNRGELIDTLHHTDELLPAIQNLGNLSIDRITLVDIGALFQNVIANEEGDLKEIVALVKQINKAKESLRAIQDLVRPQAVLNDDPAASWVTIYYLPPFVCCVSSICSDQCPTGQ